MLYLAATPLKLQWLKLGRAHFERCTCMCQNPFDWPLQSAANSRARTSEGHLVTAGEMKSRGKNYFPVVKAG